MTIQWLVSVFFVSLLSIYLLFVIVEPIFIFLFNRPIYIHFYPFPSKLTSVQQVLIARYYPFYTRLSTRKKRYFEHRIVKFLKRYQFVGRDIEITDEIKLLIAGSYIMLTFGLRKYLIRVFETIIVYSHSYKLSSNDNYHKGEFNAKAKAVVFSWEDFLLGLQSENDNVNLGLHEFGHALHFHGLRSKDASAIVFYDAFNMAISYFLDPNLKKQLQQKGYFRDYAYVNEFEFMAVVFEYFFESPQLFKKNHPALFAHVSIMLNIR